MFGVLFGKARLFGEQCSVLGVQCSVFGVFSVRCFVQCCLLQHVLFGVVFGKEWLFAVLFGKARFVRRLVRQSVFCLGLFFKGVQGHTWDR